MHIPDVNAPRIFKIVLTGGPCSAKSESLNYLRGQIAQRLNYTVLVCPEIATHLFSQGVDNRSLGDPEGDETFQDTHLYLQRAHESALNRQAEFMLKKTGQSVVIIFDRGALDSKCFCSAKAWRHALRQNDCDEQDIKYSSDAVFHMESLAVYSAEEYGKVRLSNPKRVEDVAAAIAADSKLKNTYVGHPHLRIIKAAESYSEKREALLNQILNFIRPNRIEYERKFLVSCEKIPVHFESYFFEQIYLLGDEEARVRLVHSMTGRRIKAFLTAKKKAESGRFENEIPIHGSPLWELSHAAYSEARIEKTRTYFLYENQYFELDSYRNIYDDSGNELNVLEIELDSPEQSIQMPPFITVHREVTGVPAYTNKALAKREI